MPKKIDHLSISEHFRGFESSYGTFSQLTQILRSDETTRMRHSELECLISKEGRELLRQMLEEHIRLRGLGDAGAFVVGSDGEVRSHKRLRSRVLTTVFGDVKIDRIGYGSRGRESLFPKDAALNLPIESYSHGIRKLIAKEVAKSSFDDAVDSVLQLTGVTIPKRSCEELAQKAAQDFESFYADKVSRETKKETKKLPLLILTSDGKGIVMRRGDLTQETQRKAQTSQHKLKKRLSKGEKANAKRIATVASVYAIDTYTRSAEDVVGEINSQKSTKKPPKPFEKRVWASIQQTAEEVLNSVFEEARSRDPKFKKKWVFLVDGNKHQIKCIRKYAKKIGINITIVLDIIHVLEYLWKASRVFYPEASLESERWVMERLRSILEGNACHVAAGMRRAATLRLLEPFVRTPIDKCANYLLNNKIYLNYDKYLAEGLPIATGVIEGACRHLVKDRMDVTGARWSLAGAEAVLKLRSLKSSKDFEEYWKYHEDQEYHRNHCNLYLGIDEIFDKMDNRR